MSAFFSGTDNRDDSSAYCYSGVIGNLERPTPSSIFRLNIGEEKLEVKHDDIFDFTPQLPEVPQEWLDKVSVTGYGSGFGLGIYDEYGYGGYGGYGGWAQRGNVHSFRRGTEVGGTGQKKPNGESGPKFADPLYSLDNWPVISPESLSPEERTALIAIMGAKTADELGIHAARTVTVVNADEELTPEEDAILEFLLSGQVPEGNSEDPTDRFNHWKPGTDFTVMVKALLYLREINTEQYPTL